LPRRRPGGPQVRAPPRPSAEEPVRAQPASGVGVGGPRLGARTRRRRPRRRPSPLPPGLGPRDRPGAGAEGDRDLEPRPRPQEEDVTATPRTAGPALPPIAGHQATLDGVRAVAALGVLVYHVAATAGSITNPAG